MTDHSKSAEQQARDLLDAMEVEGAQNYSSGELVELANLIAERNRLAREVERLRERQESHDLANEAIRWKGRALKSEARVTAFRAVIDDIRDYLDECDEEDDVSWFCIVDDIRMFLADLEAKP